MQPRLFDPTADPLPPDDSTLTVGEVIRLYLRHAEAEKIHGPVARADRLRILPEFSAAMGGLLVADAKPYHLREFIEAHPQWVSPATRRAKANYIRAAFNWAFENERIPRHPFRSVRYCEAEPRPAMSDEAFSLFAKYGNKRFEAALRFLRYTGCRLSEMCRAQWPHMDLERGEWMIPEHKTRKFTKRPKYVALASAAVELVRAQDRVNDFVFVNSHGHPWFPTTLGSCFRWMKKRYGIQTTASLHGLRHAATSAMLGRGVSPKIVAEQLGHADLRTLDIYYHRDDSHLAAMREGVERGLPRDS